MLVHMVSRRDTDNIGSNTRTSPWGPTWSPELWKHARLDLMPMRMLLCRDCQFSLNQSAPQTLEVQLGVQGYWAMCSQECKQQFLKNWLRVHFEVAAQRFGERQLLARSTRPPVSCIHNAASFLTHRLCVVCAVITLRSWQPVQCTCH